MRFARKAKQSSAAEKRGQSESEEESENDSKGVPAAYAPVAAAEDCHVAREAVGGILRTIVDGREEVRLRNG